MKTVDTHPTAMRIPDPVIREVRQIKEEIVAEHGGDIRQLLRSLRERQMSNPRLTRKIEGEAGAGQLASRTESKTEGGDEPQPESEGRSR